MQYTDFLSDVLHRIIEHVSLPHESVLRIEQEVRRDWGGERPYIAKIGELVRRERSGRDDRIRSDYRRGERADLLARRYGISKRTVWRIVSSSRNLAVDLAVEK